MKKILVAKLRHHGDVLMSTPVFSNLKKRYPQAHIDAYIYKETKPMLDGHPAINGFVLYDKGWKKRGKLIKLFFELKLLWKIFRGGYDMVLNLTEGDRGAMAALVSKANVRVGFDPEGSGMWGKSKCYTHIAKIEKGYRHAALRNLDILAPLGIEIVDEELTFKYEDIDAPKDFILIHPVSRWMFKCWPAAKVAKLIRILHERGETIVLSASPDPQEIKMLNQIRLLCPDIPLIDMGGKTTLKTLGGLIKKSKLLITVDSVPLHIASALKAPTVAIFGPTSEKNWAPYKNPHARVVFEPMACRPCFQAGCNNSGRSECLERLSVERVLSAVDAHAVL